MILHLGVTDIPYAQAPRALRAKRVSGTQTTGDVAQWIENKYGLMQAFYDANADFVSDRVADSVAGAVESMMMGAPFSIDPFGSATSKIEERFKDFLTNREAEALGISGVPTMAALRGVNHRLKRPYDRSNPRRPSFIDTALYQASFKAWVER